MADLDVAGVMMNSPDAAGVDIETIYAKAPPLYAVYRTADRVMVHYADDPDKASTQRTNLSGLNPLRGEINSLIDGWRANSRERLRAKAKRYDRGVADALIVALENDAASADLVLKDVRQRIIDERTSWARFLYLMVASSVALGVVVLLWASSALSDTLVAQPAAAVKLMLLAAGAGAVGAFFSIAVAIRKRTVLTDLRQRDNAADAVLRVLIGVIGAALLICLLLANAATITIGSASFGGDMFGQGARAWILVVIAGFAAGFSEQLVPDLLAKSALGTSTDEAAQTARIGAAPAPNAAPAGEPQPPAPAAAAGDGEEADDACPSGQGFDERNATPDDHLPAAR